MFVGSDSLYGSDLGPIYDGSLAVFLKEKTLHEYLKHLNTRTPLTSARTNPWFMEIWQSQKNCSYTDSSRLNCSRVEQEALIPYTKHTFLTSTIDAIDAVALAVDQLIGEHCPEMFLDAEGIRDCVTGELLIQYIKNISFQGANWEVSFDESGDLVGSYVFEQYHSDAKDKFTTIAKWDKHIGEVIVNTSITDWSHFIIDGSGLKSHYDGDYLIPDSVCSYECGTLQYKQQRELICCWDCMTCRNNEIINADRDGCEKCPVLMWPDEETSSYCIQIEPR